MARLYLNFFDQAESAWKLTEEIVLDAANGVSPKNILDVASGPGEPGLTLAKSFPIQKVLVTDGADAMIQLAEMRIKNQGLEDRVNTACMDLNDFSPVKDKPVDLVTAQFALMFTEDLPGSLSEIHGVLRDGGLLVGTVWKNSTATVEGYHDGRSRRSTAVTANKSSQSSRQGRRRRCTC